MATQSHGVNGPAIRRTRPHRASVLAVLLAGCASLAMASVTAASSGPAPPLERATAGPYRGVLVASNHWSLYVLSAERGGTIHCRASCLTFWPPLLVKTSVTHVTLGSGVKGKIGFVKRSATTKQVTFNGYPVYVFSGDTGSLQVNGEGIRADGGTWTLAHSGATTAAATPVKLG